MNNKLVERKKVWNSKKFLRETYKVWYKKIIKDIKNSGGKTVEIGAGSGNFKEFKPNIISSDIYKYNWIDLVFDAHKMPFDDRSISNLVLIDVLHHLDNPIRFFEESVRVLEPGGRIILVEPYPSLFSWYIYRKLHPEPFLFDVNYFGKKEVLQKDPWNSNQAMSYLLFFKHRHFFLRVFSDKLKFIKRQKISFILYPASGGFDRKSLAPDFFIPFFKFLEVILFPLRFFLAFRCYIVLEKITDKI